MTNPGFWRGRTVLVAGGTGFLGGWLVRRLVEWDARVVTVVRSPRANSQFYMLGFDKLTVVEHGSVDDAEFMADVFRRHNVEFFFHCAYGADVNRVLQEPFDCFRSCVQSTWSILDFLRRSGNGCVSVVSSTDKAYGTQELPYRENRPLNPLHPYEVAKASQDLVTQSYGKVFGCPVAVTRCGNYFGPFDFNYTRLIPGVVKSIMSGERPLLRSDGQFTRDYLYIEDAVDVQLLLAERLTEDKSLYGEAFNFSYGEQVTVLEMVQQITRLMGTDLQPLIRNEAKSEIRHMHLSSDKAAELLRWQPEFGFLDGLRKTVGWYSEHFSNAIRSIPRKPVEQVMAAGVFALANLASL